MFGLRFIKAQPTHYVIQYRRGQILREGTGLAFWYFAPTTSLVLVPMESKDVPFIFTEVTADFQDITIQGQVTYRVSEPKQLAQLVNFTLDPSGRGYASDDPEKLPQRLIDHVQVATRAALATLSLRQALGAADALVGQIREQVQKAVASKALGIEVLGLSILAIKPKSETARALEAQVREQLLKEADEAVYRRRNAAVEQERAIKENELNTEMAIEEKRRQMKEAQMAGDIALEEKNKELVVLSTENARQQADARAYEMAAVMKALSGTDGKVIQALASVGMDAGQLVAAGFRQLAESANKIGQLNVSPDLLRELINQNKQE